MAARLPEVRGSDMSIGPKGGCPPGIQTVLEICQQTFIEARMSNDDALSTASMLLGFTCLNITEGRKEALEAFSDCIYDIYKYIDENFDQVQDVRRKIRERRRD
jgi:hypothetical protein